MEEKRPKKLLDQVRACPELAGAQQKSPRIPAIGRNAVLAGLPATDRPLPI